MKTPYLSAERATEVTVAIKNSAAPLIELIIEAAMGQAHISVGYPNWADYAKNEFPKYKLAVEPRRVFVDEMKQAGMSNMAIAAALNVDEGTIRKDLKALDADSTSATPPAAKTAPRRSATPIAVLNRDRVAAYEKVVADHPLWQVAQIASYLKITPKAARRLGYCANAPAVVKQYLYDGQISIAVVEAVLSPALAERLPEEDLLNVIHKVANGQVPMSSTTGLREVMETVSRAHGEVRQRWLSTTEAMTYDELKIALLDQEAATAHVQRTRQERAKARAKVTDLDRMLYGPKTYAWLDTVESRLGTIFLHAEEVLTSNAFVGQGDNLTLNQRLREIGMQFFSIADHVESLLPAEKEKPSSRPNLTVVPAQVVEDHDGHEVISGVVL